MKMSETQVSTLTQGAGDIPLHAYTNTARLGLITRGGVTWYAEEYGESETFPSRLTRGHEVSYY